MLFIGRLTNAETSPMAGSRASELDHLRRENTRLIALLEANALFGKQGVLTTVRGVITSSVVYALAESSAHYHAHEWGDLFAHLARHLAPHASSDTAGTAGLSEATATGTTAVEQGASRELAERVAQLETESTCRSLLEELNRTADRPRLAALASLGTETDRRRLIESWPARDTPSRPRPTSSPPLTSRNDPLDHLPNDLRGFIAALR